MSVDDIRAAVHASPLRATPGQESMWLLWRLHPSAPLNHMVHEFRFDGALNAQRLRDAARDVVARHQALRARFNFDGRHLWQRFETPVDPPWREVDLGAPGGGFAEEALAREQRSFACAPFDLEAGGLIRFLLVRLHAGCHLLLVCAHHIVVDGPSWNVITDELAGFYAGRPPPAAEARFADCADVPDAARLEAARAFWRRRLDGAPGAIALPFDRPPPAAPGWRSGERELALPQALSDALRATRARLGTSTFRVLLAAFAALLARVCGQPDLVVATTLTGRPAPRMQAVVGLLINTAPIRVAVDGDASFDALVAQVDARLREALQFEDCAFERVMPGRADDSGGGFAEPAVRFVKLPRGSGRPRSAGSLRVAQRRRELAASPVDLAVYVDPGAARISVHTAFNRDRFDDATIDELMSQYVLLLAGLVERPGVAPARCSLATARARSLLPDPRLPLPAPAQRTVVDTIAAVAARDPGAAAVKWDANVVSYAELCARAAALARLLDARLAVRGRVVAVDGRPSPGLVVAMLGVLASGNTLLLLDDSLPPRRRRLMLERARASGLVRVGDAAAADAPCLAVVDAVTGVTDQMGDAGGDLAAASRARPPDPAYVFFTSGSTGEPKAVHGWHGALDHFLAWQRRTFAVAAGDRVALLAAPTFDAILRDVFLPLTAGATLCIPPRGTTAASGGAEVFGWLRRERVTLLHVVPSLGSAWLAHAAQLAPLPGVRCTFFMGEPLAGELVERWRATCPAAEVVNLYGPTEATLIRTWFRVPRPAPPGVQSIGAPIDDTQAVIVDRGGRQCAVNEPGEICLRSPFLSLGYLDDPCATAERFVANPLRGDPADRWYRTGDSGRVRADGALVFCGRLDGQVKINGVRIEPGEIAAALRVHPGVAEAAVVAHADARGVPRLIACYTVAGGGAVGAADLQGFLAERMPLSMIPSAIVEVERMPLLANGKIDAAALRLHERAAPPRGAAPASATERALAAIFASVLECERIGIDDSFYDHNGSSLQAMRILARIELELGVRLLPSDFLRRPTVRGVAALLGTDTALPRRAIQE